MFEVATPCSLVYTYQGLGGTYCLHHRGGRMNNFLSFMYFNIKGGQVLAAAPCYCTSCEAILTLRESKNSLLRGNNKTVENTAQ